MSTEVREFPENVRKLVCAIEAATGPSGIPAIEPNTFLIFGERVGLDAASQAAAFRWLAKHYHGTRSSVRRKAGKQFEQFAAALEEASRANSEPTASSVDVGRVNTWA